MKLRVDQPPLLKRNGDSRGKQVQEPDVEGPRQVRVLVEVREEPGIEVRPVGGHADARVVEVRARQRIRDERGPEADQDRDEHRRLDAQRREGEQEQDRVAEADLGERVFEGPVGLRPFERSQEDAEQDQRDAAPQRVQQQTRERIRRAPSGWPARTAARRRPGTRTPAESGRAASSPATARASCCRPRPPRSGSPETPRCSVHSRIASASIRNITKPRNASIDVIRVAAAGGAAAACADRTGTATVLMVAAFYCRRRSRCPLPASRFPLPASRFPLLLRFRGC